jgi:hypothetical protein
MRAKLARGTRTADSLTKTPIPLTALTSCTIEQIRPASDDRTDLA